MTDSHLERALTNVIVEVRARDAKEKGQLVPALEQVLERLARLAELRVGLDPFLVELSARSRLAHARWTECHLFHVVAG